MFSSIQIIRRSCPLQPLQHSQFRLTFPLAIRTTPCFTCFTTRSHRTSINFHMSQMACFLYFRLSLSGWTSNRLCFPTKRRTFNSHIHTRTRKNDQHHLPHSPRIRRLPPLSSYRVRTEAADVYESHDLGIGCQSFIYLVRWSDEYCFVEIYEPRRCN
jgi:hypothetical protein